MTPDEQARALCDAATPGPWNANTVSVKTADGESILVDHLCIGVDLAFIAAARTGWPEALERIRKLEAHIARIRAVADEGYPDEGAIEYHEERALLAVIREVIP